MRVIVFFDLPVTTSSERRAYRKFRTFLIKEGFIMRQESVYSKLVVSPAAANLVKNRIRMAAPKCGVIEVLIITEKQYAGIEFITGSKSERIINDLEKVIVI